MRVKAGPEQAGFFFTDITVAESITNRIEVDK